jgi:hypothetical protein
MDKIWKQGSMKSGIMKRNPSLCEKFIIDPFRKKQNKGSVLITNKSFKFEKLPSSIHIGTGLQVSNIKSEFIPRASLAKTMLIPSSITQ